MTDSEILATIKLTALETAQELRKELAALVQDHAARCAAHDGVNSLHSTVGYTTTAPEDTVHRRIQRVEISLWKLCIWLVASASVGGGSSWVMSHIFGGG